MSKFLVIIAGPTACGKTATGIALAKHYKTEIISADSRQIYKETSIGTAVPSPEELKTVAHHFIQEISLNNYYNASMYELDVLKRLKQLYEKYRVIFMVGGSGMYINAVCFGIDDLPTVDQKIRTNLAEKFEKEGLVSLQEKLKQLDPVSYERIDLNNQYRVLKALEISIQTGRPYSSFLTHQKRERDFQIIRVGLDMDREILYKRINSRVDEMMKNGLMEEVKGLIEFRSSNALKTVGYRELFSYLDKKISMEEALDLIKRNTRKYARKQLTWFRKDKLFPWFHPQNLDIISEYIDQEMQKRSKSTHNHTQ
ncbi:tRNA (adenosine(37)-N6)-dimethylallyltransferase MiaA [Bacteroidota bacterium]